MTEYDASTEQTTAVDEQPTAPEPTEVETPAEPERPRTHRSGLYFLRTDHDLSVYQVWLDHRVVMHVAVPVQSDDSMERVILISDADMNVDWTPTSGRAQWNDYKDHVDSESVRRYVMPRVARFLADLYVSPRPERPAKPEIVVDENIWDAEVEV